MNVLFIGLSRIDSINDRGLYTDFLREIEQHGHSLTVLTCFEKRDWHLNIKNKQEKAVNYVYAKTGNITKNNNFIDKGVSVVKVGQQLFKAIKNSPRGKYDVVICTTPCNTFEYVVRKLKQTDNAKIVLLLKDIWPYDLVFDGILSTTGPKRLIFNYFKKISEQLFDEADVIGCMTPQNKTFLEMVYHDSLPLEKAIIIPNSIEPLNAIVSDEEIKQIRSNYNIPEDKVVFLYGGNLGVAQGAGFIIDAIKQASKTYKEAFFFIVGNGTEAKKITESLDSINNVSIIPAIPHDDYEKLVYACDVGLIFLNWNCHSPNCPSRILQYMQASIPVICAVDDTTDIGEIVFDNKFGLTCKSNDINQFSTMVGQMLESTIRKKMGSNARRFLEKNYTSKTTYELVFCESE